MERLALGFVEFREQIEDAPPLPQRHLRKIVPIERDAPLRQNLAIRCEVEFFGVDQHTVVIPKNSLYHESPCVACGV